MVLVWLLSPIFRRKDSHTLLQMPQARKNNNYSFFSFTHTSLWITRAVESIKRHQACSSDQDKSFCRSDGAQEEVLPNFTQKFQAKTLRRLTSNIWVSTSFQTNLGTWKRKDLETHRMSEMGQHCGLPIEWPTVSVFLGLRSSPACGNFSAKSRKLPGKQGQVCHSIFQRTEICFELLDTPRASCLTSKFTSSWFHWLPSPSNTYMGWGSMHQALCHLLGAFLVVLVQKKEILGSCKE